MVGSAQAGTAHAYRSSLMQAAAAASHLVARLQEDGRLHRAASAGRRTCRAAASSRAGSIGVAGGPTVRPRSAVGSVLPPTLRRGRAPRCETASRPPPCSSPRCVGFRSPKTRLLRASVHRAWPLHRRDLSMAQLAWHVPVKMRSPGTSVKSRLHVECHVAWDAPCSVCAVVVHVCVCVRARACACVCARERRGGGREGAERDMGICCHPNVET